MSEAVAGTAPVERLQPGRHGLSREQVRESQRRRLTAAATAGLAEHGYGAITLTGVARGAGVSTATFYQHFDDVWGCLLAAFEDGGERLCEVVEAACATASGEAEDRVRAGVAGALGMRAAEPALAYLLSTEPPSRAGALWAARRRLVARLAAMLGSVRDSPDRKELEAHRVGAAFALLSIQRGDRSSNLDEDLAPALAAFLLSR